jgi:ribosomal protein L37AE/L43A
MCASLKCGVAKMEVIETGAGAKWSIDCPKCKYGTLDHPHGLIAICADCGETFTHDQLVDLGVIANRKISKKKTGE